MRMFVLITVLITASYLASGCGETVNGVAKDTKRIGSGVHKIFIRES
ncbi:MAG: hypothetical protein PHW46_04420 [Candidatus Omnitrophica bacterium]|nr:hypothetical protein [Candidatus Omnitrophota bacterium]